MKVISIGTDRKLFEEGSAVRTRLLEYASKTDEYHVIVFTLAKMKLSPERKGNLFLYPTNSFSKLTYIFSAERIARQIIKKGQFKNNFAVISAQDPFETGFAAYRVSKKSGLPLQLQIHTDFLDPHFNNSFLNKIRIMIAKFILPKSDGIRVVSEAIRESLRTTFSDLRPRVDILPVFVDIEKIVMENPIRSIQSDFSKYKFIILMASRLEREKRIDIAILAMKSVIKIFPHVGLVICGDGSQKKDLQELVVKNDLEESVSFAPWQSELLSYYKTANMFLVTSEYEGYGMTLIEAAASGCPIVTTKVGIAKTELFKSGENSLVCDSLDAGCVAKDIVEMIGNNQKREVFKRRMLENIVKMAMSRNTYAESYINLLKTLLRDE